MKSHLLNNIKAGLLLFFAMILTMTVSATVFNVNTTNDTHAVNPAAGTGLDASGNISFRSALEAANAVGGTHTVNLQALTYNLTLGEITIGDFTQNITINGVTAASTIVNMTATNRDRILFINSTGTNPNITTVINNVSFTNGQLNTDTYGGGAIIAGGPNNSLTLNGCIFSGNSIGAAGTAATQGGAVRYNGGGSLTIDNCTFSNNSNNKSDGGAVSYFLENLVGAGNGALTITNSTFNNNSVTAGAGSGGGAIHVSAQGRITAGITFTVNILRNTFTSNAASGASGVGGAIRTVNSFDVGNTMNINYNRFVNNTSTTGPNALAMASAQGNVNANDNWWGCNTGPTAAGPCDKAAIVGSGGVGTLTAATWLQLRLTAATSPICYTTGTSLVTASFLNNSSGGAVSLANLVRVIGQPITFSAALGTLSGAQTTIQANGTATVLFTAGATGGTGTVNGVVDNIPAAETSPARASITINRPVVTNPGVSTGTAGTAFSQTFTASGGSAPYTFSTSSTLPAGLTLSSAGVLSGTPTVVGTFPIVVNVSDNISCTAAGTTYNLVINCQTITVSNPGTATGTVGTAFSQTFTQSNAIGGATFTLNSGTLPAGLTLSSAGVLSGTPTQSGTFPITVRATDANNCFGNGATYNLVISCQTITVTNPATATGTNGTAFSQTFTQSGALGGATFTVFSGTLPNGLTLSAAGVLSGTPAAPAGTYPVVIRVTDGNGCFANGPTYNLVISCQSISVTNPAVTTGQLSIPFSQTFTQTGGIGATTFSLFSGSLPAGLTLSSAGVLSGTPTATGTFNLVIRATDANGCFANGPTYTLVITACPVNDQTVTASPTSVCTGLSSTVTVGASQPGVNYTLRNQAGNVVIAGPTADNGPAINFNTGNLTVPTTFNVLAETDKYSVNMSGGQGGFTIPNSASISLFNNFTIEGWVKPNNAVGFSRMFNKDQSYALGLSNDQSAITFTAHNQGDYSVPFAFTTNTWYHIACTYASGTVEFFVNGVSVGTVNSVPAPNSATQGAHIGSDAGGSFHHFEGNIDNVRLWSSVRTVSEIATNQNAYLTSTGNPTLAGSWWIIEGSGNARDFSVNANNATALVGTWQVDAPVAPCSIVLTQTPTVSITPNNTITLSSPAGTNAQTVCVNTAITNITYNTTGATGATFSGLPGGVTGSWSGNVVTITGTPNTTVGSPFNYTVTLTGGCAAVVTATGTITVNPTNTITLSSAAGTNAQTVCLNTAITNITYNTTGATGATFSGLPGGVTGSWSGNVVTITGSPNTTAGSPFSYTVTLTGGCGVVTATGTITVNPTPDANATPSSQTVCSGTAITTIVISGSVPLTTFNWTRDNTGTVTGIAASGSGNISGTLTNTTNAPVTVTFTITPTANGCPGAPVTATVIVNPIPNAVATPASQTSCSNSAITGIVLSGNVAGTVYNWTRDNTGTVTGIPASGSGNISGVLTNTTASPVTVTFTIIPSYTNAGTTCTGTSITATVIVNPQPNTTITGGGVTVCGGSTVTLSAPAGGTTYNWQYFYAEGTTATTVGTSDTYNATKSGVYRVTVNNSYNCPATSAYTAVNIADYVFNGSLGAGDATQTGRINRFATISTCAAPQSCPGIFTSAGARYYDAYTITNPRSTPVCATIGYSSGCGSNSFVVAYNGSFNPASVCTNYLGDPGSSFATNSYFEVTIPANGTIVVVVHEVNPGAGCAAYTLTVDVPRETPGVTASPSANVCTGTPVTLTASAANSYLWTPGGQTTQSIIVSTTNTYGVTLGYGNNGCTATASQVVNVTATPTVNAVANQSVCNGTPTTAVNFTGTPAGVVFNWTNNTPSIGLAASGTGNIASFNAINTGGTPVTATITVTPSFTGGAGTCTGTPITFTITVNPTPVATATPSTQTTCSGATIAPIALTSNVPGTNFSWTRDNTGTVTGIAASGTGNSITGALTNTTNAPVSVTFTITPQTTSTLINESFNTASGATMPAGWSSQNRSNPIGTNTAGWNQFTTAPWSPFSAPNHVGANFNATAGAGTISAWLFAPNVTLSNGDVLTFYTRTTSNPSSFPDRLEVRMSTNGASTNVGATETSVGDFTTVLLTVNPSLTTTGYPGTFTQFTATLSGLPPGGVSGRIAFRYFVTNGGPTGANSDIISIDDVVLSTAAGTSCTGTPTTATVIVNPTPTVNAVTSQVVCNGAPTTAVTFSGAVTGTVYNWTNNTPSIGLAASGTGNIASFNAINATNAPVTATITVTPSYTNAGTTCTGTPITFTITVNPTATVNTVANQVVCNGAPTTAVTFSSPTTGGTIVYNWTNNTPSIGLAASGTGNIASFNAVNVTNAPVTATITVTPSYTNGSVTCVGTPRSFTITVNPTAVVNPVANQVVCNTASTTAITFSSPTTGGTIVYNWTNNTPSIGLAASGSGNIASFTATNATNAPVTATITVTPAYTNGAVTCNGTPLTFTITVNPTPIVNSIANQVVCNGELTADIFFSSPTTGGTIVYNWTNNNTSIGLAASGTANIPAFTATNATNAPVTATITVIASYTNGGTTCTSAPVTFTITVNPTPVVNSVANQVVCNNASTTAVTFSSPTTGGTIVYNWTNNNTSIGLAASGTGNIPSFTATNATSAPVTATITVTASYTNGGTTCTSAPVTFTITVNPTPVVASVPNQVLCNGGSTTAVNFSSPTTGGTIVYNWTNNTPSIGLAASGSGNIASFTATNATNAPVTATITVIASYTNGGTTCTSAPVTFTITVNPTPTVNVVANQTVCNGSATAAVTFTGNVAGTVYEWTNSNTAIGLAASGTGNIASFTATNATNAPITGTITVTPTYTNGGVTCAGTPRTFTITVNPIPTVSAVANQVVCNGSATPAINFNGTVAGTVYSWTNNTTSIGLAASGTGNIASFTATNTGTTPVTATITVTPSYTNGSTTCTGTPITFTITVNPSTVITTQPANQTLCAGGNASFTGAATGVGLSYQWQVNTGTGFTNIANGGVYSNATTTTLNITGVTATMNGYQYRLVVTGTCGVQNTNAATLTVNTPPNITTQPVNTSACIGANTSFTVVATGTALTYQWQVNTGSGFTNITNGGVYSNATTATLNITGVTAAMNGYQYQVVINGTCTPSATSNPATLTINTPVNITTQPASVTICFGGSPTFTVAATGTGLTYQWQVNTGSGFVNIPGATGTSYTVPNPTVLFSLYQYRVVVTGTCNTVISNTATLIVFALPNINFSRVPPRVCLTDTVLTLKAEPAGGTWTGRGVSGDKFSPTAAGTGVSTLTYTVTNANGCISIEHYNITVNDCRERHNSLQTALRIYPNPSNGRFSIGFMSDLYKEFNLRVIDAKGAVVKEMRFTGLSYGSVIPMDLTNLASGMYILEAYNTQERASYRIVITR